MLSNEPCQSLMLSGSYAPRPKRPPAPYRLRSYNLPDELNIPATICDAALATSAATGFFDPVSIGARRFVDGALGANNPVDEVEGEASNIWSDTGGSEAFGQMLYFYWNREPTSNLRGCSASTPPVPLTWAFSPPNSKNGPVTSQGQL